MLLMTLIFSPIEVLWPAYPKQSVFRPEWLLDVVYFLSTHLPIRITTFLILLPATQLTQRPGQRRPAASDGQPALAGAVLPGRAGGGPRRVLASIERLHEVPWLWRFHAIHHSSKALDWIAGSRAHLVDDLIIRGLMLIPMMFMFSQDIITAYLLFVTIHATWAHTNFGPSIKWLEPYLVFPRFHHWHHTSQKEAIDKNYAIHFPWIDKLFGTYYLPKDRLAGDLRPAQRADTGRLLGPDLLSVHPQEGGR